MDAQRALMFQSLEAFLIDAVGADIVERAGKILEFGCGKTGYIDHYVRGAVSGFGVDLHDLEAHWAARGICYLQSDGATIPVTDRFFDLIVSHSVVEHIDDLPASLAEMNRVLATGGIAYITVSPLYFSPRGAHVRDLPDWEHLRPGSDHFMMTRPIDRDGASLNKLVVAEFLRMIGRLPWDIVRLERKLVDVAIPAWLAAAGHDPLDLLTREFRLVARKQAFAPRLADHPIG